MTQYVYLANRVLDRNGIADSSSIFFYLSGTTTLIDIYSDPDYTIELPNPLRMVMGAAIPPVYWQEGSVRVVVIDSSGEVVSDDDPYTPFGVEGLSAELASPDPGKGDDIVSHADDYAETTVRNRINILSATARPAMVGIFSSGVDQRAALLDFISKSAADGKTIEWGPIDLSLDVEAGATDHKGLLIPSGSRWVLHPNTRFRALAATAGDYQILNLHSVEDVVIEGNSAKIVGDRDTHLGATGEWGMGVSMRGSKNVTIKELTVEDCWGDGIYIGSDDEISRTPCENIELVRVIARNNRRTGMGVINAINLGVLSCKFLDTNGVPLEAGVDLEPNNVAEVIRNARFQDCDFEGNAGGGLMTAGPVTDSWGVFVTNCRFKDNSYNLASTIRDTFVTDCLADGSSVSTAEFGGFTIVDGAVRDCTARNMRRSAFGVNGNGNAVFENNRSEYMGKAGGTEEDTGFYINKTGGEVIARGNTFHARANSIRGTGTASYVEIIDNTLIRHHGGAFSSTHPLHLQSLAVSTPSFIESNRFPIPTGAVTNGALVTVHADSSYLIEGNKMAGWDRNITNWLFQTGGGSGVVRFGAGNWLPNSTFDRPVSWQRPRQINGYSEWYDAGGKLRTKSSAPTSDTDGVIVGTQT